jgi:hypothetical protein
MLEQDGGQFGLVSQQGLSAFVSDARIKYLKIFKVEPRHLHIQAHQQSSQFVFKAYSHGKESLWAKGLKASAYVWFRVSLYS